MAGGTDETAVSGADGHEAPSTPPRLLAAPGYAVRWLYQAYTAAWARQVDPTLTGPQFAVLTAVHSYPGVDQGSLASSVALDRSTMADIAKRLEDRGLIVREPAPTDGRRKLLYLSEDGEAKLAEIDRLARQLDERLLEGYAPTERERLLEELSMLSSRWEAIAEDS